MNRPASLTIIISGLIATWLLVACTGQPVEPAAAPAAQATPTPAPESTERGTGDTLRLLYSQAPETLNPHLSTNNKDWEASRITYEPLASFDKDGNLIPFLAAEIPSLENGGLAEDGQSVTWKLKPDVKWSDGQPFTAADVRFTYEFVTNPEVKAASAPIYSPIADVEIIDDYTVRVIFEEVNPAWSLPFVGIQGVILPRHVFEPYNGPNATDAPANTFPVGTGPYRALEPGLETQEVLFLGNRLVETNRILFEPNPFFREADKPFFSRVELKGGGTEKEAARLALQSGGVDYAWNLQVDAETLDELEAAGQGRVVPNLGGLVERIVLNLTDPNPGGGERSSLKRLHPFLSDLKVRQALAYAIDREAIAALYGKAGQPTGNILVSPANYQSPNTAYEFNLDKAAALLDEAGWVDSNGNGIRDKDGLEMRMLFQTTSNSLRQQTQEMIRRWLRSIGVEVKLEVTPSSDFFSSDPANTKSYYHFYADLQEYQDGNKNPDPGSYLEWWTCDQIPQEANSWSAGENVGRWCNAAYDALYRQSEREVDPQKREQLFIKMNDMIIEDVAVIPLVHRARVSGVSQTIEGLDPTPWDAELWNIKDWRRISP